MSLKFAHSSKGVYLFPISHSNEFHNLLYYDINLNDSARLGSHCEQIGSHCAWLGYEQVVNTVIDYFITVLDLLVKE